MWSKKKWKKRCAGCARTTWHYRAECWSVTKTIHICKESFDVKFQRLLALSHNAGTFSYNNCVCVRVFFIHEFTLTNTPCIFTVWYLYERAIVSVRFKTTPIRCLLSFHSFVVFEHKQNGQTEDEKQKERNGRYPLKFFGVLMFFLSLFESVCSLVTFFMLILLVHVLYLVASFVYLRLVVVVVLLVSRFLVFSIFRTYFERSKLLKLHIHTHFTSIRWKISVLPTHTAHTLYCDYMLIKVCHDFLLTFFSLFKKQRGFVDRDTKKNGWPTHKNAGSSLENIREKRGDSPFTEHYFPL